VKRKKFITRVQGERRSLYIEMRGHHSLVSKLTGRRIWLLGYYFITAALLG
jgi:hypothetical protein